MYHLHSVSTLLLLHLSIQSEYKKKKEQEKLRTKAVFMQWNTFNLLYVSVLLANFMGEKCYRALQNGFNESKPA